MTAPKAVIFDLGKVLLNFDYGIAIRRIQGRSKMSIGQLHQLIDQSPLLYRFETNLLTTEQFFAEVQAVAGFSGDFAEFAEMFGDIFTPIGPMVQLHQDLRQAGVPAYIFSNTNYLAVEHIRRRYPFFQDFDGYVLSCDHQVMKPDPRLYEVVETVAGARGCELVYIDDRPENVATGLARNWQSILHETPEKTRQAILQTGLLTT
jgi:2-haloacid dehalogenase